MHIPKKTKDTLRERLQKFVGKGWDYGLAATSGAGMGILILSKLQRLSDQDRMKLARDVAGPLLSWLKGNDNDSLSDSCADCEGYPFGFILHDETWEKALRVDALWERQQESNVYLCAACVDKRLRTIDPDAGLTVDDFDPSYPINLQILFMLGHMPEKVSVEE